jgi:hypothetical protein
MELKFDEREWCGYVQAGVEELEEAANDGLLLFVFA